ncbi:hypothetical protein RJ639_028498 [Escallonia herrerae]|uniref:non-specific serine/threonine protein kinase n=1 Tax=Escallonia herrerae TaxID=1293975 RepID=A0AA89BJM1_9ASTE|nr:hypothetical protein RJ639_028498 [Escallonia herrerae]
MAGAFVTMECLLLLLYSSFVLAFLATLGFAATPRLHQDEVRALREIGKRLGKTDWDFSKNPCGKEGNWSSSSRKGSESFVMCDCSFDHNTTCHVVSMALKSQNFSSGVPPEFSKLRHLKSFSFMGNRLSGPFPVVLTKITTLTNLSIEGNQFSGPIPREIGRLINLQKLVLSSNAFIGRLPVELGKLHNLIDLRISDNSFTGKIPDFILNWTQIEKLHMQGCSFEGPIPSTISGLTSLTDLVLRKCLIYGEIPEYVGDMTKLKSLDISYNSFTWESSGPIECPGGSVSRVHPCLKQSFPCSASRSQRHYSLHINCGGKEIVVNNNTKYEADLEPRGASMYYSGQSWAFSSTGNFMDNDVDADVYIDTNTSAIYNVSASLSDLYTRARVSPLSLTYYGLCLMNGNYTVKLHFAEIVFTPKSSFVSLGKRIFDVYIQGKLVLKDFNIAKEAGGVGKQIVKSFTAAVTSETLKIHFYWAGRGTTGIPSRGNYGPLISAISVDPSMLLHLIYMHLLLELPSVHPSCLCGNALKLEPLNVRLSWKIDELNSGQDFRPPSVNGRKNHVGLVVSIVGGASFLALLCLGILWRKGWLGSKISADKELRGLDLQTGLFTLRQIKAATNNFDPANKIGEGGFGSVYKVTPNLNVSHIIKSHNPPGIKSNSTVYTATEILREDACEWSRLCQGIFIAYKNWLNNIYNQLSFCRGYMAPEYAMRGYLTDKADVYSFGVVALEIVSGKSNTNYRPKEEFVYLLDWAYVLQERGSLLELVDPDLGSEYSSEEAMVMLNVSLMCTNASPTLRPTMSQAVNMLEGRTDVQDLLSDPGFSTVDTKFKAIRNHFWQNPSQTFSMSTKGPYDTNSSLSNKDREEAGILLTVSSVSSDR